MAELSSMEQTKPSNLSPVAQEVMPYMDKLTRKLRTRGFMDLANKIIREELLRETLNPQDKADFNLVVNDLREQMKRDLEGDEKGIRIVMNYLDAVEEINKQ